MSCHIQRNVTYAGVFLHLGRKVMSGNQFLGRIKALVLDEAKLDASQPTERPILELGRAPVLKFTSFQVSRHDQPGSRVGRVLIASRLCRDRVAPK